MKTKWAAARIRADRPERFCLAAGKIERLLAHHNALRRGVGAKEIDARCTACSR